VDEITEIFSRVGLKSLVPLNSSEILTTEPSLF
jgi:hypothetical protein